MATSVTISAEIAGRETTLHDVAISPHQPIEVRSVEGIADMGKVQYRPVGRCIYCGAKEDLTREHIVPFGLSGTAVLPDASCKRCARITAAFEQHVLRGPMQAVRVLRKLRSRTKHADAPTTQRLTVVRGGVPETLDIPIDQFPLLLHFPTFAPPQVLTGKQSVGIAVSGVASVSFGPHPEEVLRQLGGEKIVFESRGDQPNAFARMLAKIGFASAVAGGHDAALDGPSSVLPAILGERDDIGHWVGSTTDPIRQYPGVLHRIAIHEDHERGFLMAEIQLFADSETPTYGVILGRLREGTEGDGSKGPPIGPN